MNEEQFVSIDLDDDNVCSVCKLGTEEETLSFCHVCFELSIEGVPKSDLLHTRSLRGHRDCFEKFHLIANQDCPRSKLSKSPYAEVKNILSKKINWIIQYAQNKDLDSDPESSKSSQHQLFNFRHQTDRKLLPQFDSPVPRYSAKWIDGNSGGISSCSQTLLEERESTDFRLGMLQETGAAFCCNSVLWSNHNQAQKAEKAEGDSLTSVHGRHPQYSREECEYISIYTQPSRQGHSLNYLLMTSFQEKDSLASELNVRHIAIEQLLKNYSKLPCLQMGRAGTKSNVPI
ncbi:EURL protein, partial [Rhinoptilus africanus]|nr:EURL protein [Rhinoptilus africanus]